MKILVTVDQSALSETILEPVARIARPLNAEVLLLTVVRPAGVHETPVNKTTPEPFPVATPTGTSLKMKTVGELMPPAAETREQAFERKDAETHGYLAGQAHALEGLTVTTTTLYDNDPAEAILDYAAKEAVDLIAMATHGRTGLSHLLAGSVCEQVIRGGVAPVMVLRPGVK